MNNRDVLIIEPSPQLIPQLPEFLQKKGFGSHVVMELQQAIAALERLADPILVIDCGSDPEKGMDKVKGLIGVKELLTHPIVVVGAEVDSFERILNKYFALATTLSSPFTAGDIVEAAQYIARYHTPGKGVNTTKLAEEVTPTPSLTQPQEKSPALDAYAQFSTVSSLFFNQMEKLNLSSTSLGGKEYLRPIDQEFLKERGCFPADSRAPEIIDTICKDTGRWGRQHLCRTAYMVQQVTNVLCSQKVLCEQARWVPFVFAWSFAGENYDLLQKEYFLPQHFSLRKELCSKIKDSAMKVAVELQLPEVGNITATLARLVGHEEAATDQESSIIASIVMACELTDRICYQSGRWNPRNAHRLMYKLASGQINDIHPSVLCCIIKLLSEAIAATSPAQLLPKKVWNNEAFRKEALRARNERVAENEIKVPISSLVPGMRLARPLKSFDGKEIISEDLVLDDDLIWRIWRLSAVKPLNAPLIVFSRN